MLEFDDHTQPLNKEDLKTALRMYDGTINIVGIEELGEIEFEKEAK